MRSWLAGLPANDSRPGYVPLKLRAVGDRLLDRRSQCLRVLDHVIEDAASRGASWIEAYLHTERNEPDASHFFRGPRSMYDARGLEPIETRDRNTVVRQAVS